MPAPAYRIHLTGTQSTGKTTLAKALSEELDLTMIREAARVVAHEMGLKAMTDLPPERVYEFHDRILDKQVRALKSVAPPGAVGDRGVIDTAAHVLFILGRRKALLDRARQTLREYTHFVYLPVEFEPVDDGFRRIDPVWARQQDEAIVTLLAEWEVPHLVARGSVPERVAAVCRYLDTYPAGVWEAAASPEEK